MNYNPFKSTENNYRRKVPTGMEAKRIAEASNNFRKYLQSRGYKDCTVRDYSQALMHEKIRPYMLQHYGCSSIYWLTDERDLRILCESVSGISRNLSERVRIATLRYIEFLKEPGTKHEDSAFGKVEEARNAFEKYLIARGVGDLIAHEHSHLLCRKSIADTMTKVYGVATVYAITDVEVLSRVSILFAGTKVIDHNGRFRAAVNKYIDYLNDKAGVYNEETIPYTTKKSEKEEEKMLTPEEELQQLNGVIEKSYCIGDIFNADGRAAKVLSIRPGMFQVTDPNRTDLSSRDVNDILNSLCKLLQGGRELLSTTPALAMLYGLIDMELDYAFVRLNMDKQFIAEGLFLTFGEDGWRVDYKGWAEKLEESKSKWGYENFKGTDDVCFTSPGFDYEVFLDKHKQLWKCLQTKLDAIISLLNLFHKYMTKPDKENLLGIFNMLESEYFAHHWEEDVEKFDEFIIGVPKCNINEEIDSYHMDLESELNNSGFFTWFKKDPVTARHMLYNSETQKWDEESVARYIFGNRKKMNQEMVMTFFRYVQMTAYIKKYRIEEKAEDKNHLPEPAVETPPTPEVPQQLESIIKSATHDAPINITINYVSGNQVTKQDANIDKNFGPIINKDKNAL